VRMLVRRLVQLVGVLVLVTFFASALLSLLPGDPVNTMVPFGSDEQRERIRQELELDRPLIVQYGSWLGNFVTGDLGKYYDVSSERPVWDRVRATLPISLQLMAYAQIIALAVAIPLGVLTAYRANSRFDRTTNATAFAFISVPNFVLAPILIYFLAIRAGWFRVGGYTHFGDDAVEHFKSMLLPALSLAMAQIAVYMRLLRSDMIATLQDDFILMAKSKGVPPGRVLWRHALRPSSLTLLTVAGLNVGALIGGAVIIERIFQLPGMGRELLQAIGERQYVAMQSFVAIIAIGYVLVNFLVDITYSLLDPRIRHARAVG
jgi:peptide/nickel transport system permease protein